MSDPQAPSERLTRLFPNLASSDWHRTSPEDDRYQCIALAACYTDKKWWPWDHTSFFWPPGFDRLQPPESVPVSYFTAMFGRHFGYCVCTSDKFEVGYQKIAIYTNADGVSHMARQHFFGRGWLSKIGDLVDIVHADLGDLEGSEYGTVAKIMRRSWWRALRKGCVFRSLSAAFRFWLLRRGNNESN